MGSIERVKGKGKRQKVKGWAFAGVLLLLLGAAATSYGQTFAEWFSQKKTQIKYLTQQIVALNALRMSTEQGYAMLKNEWGSIRNWKNGEMGLHQGYYTSLSKVNPEVRATVDLNSVQSEQESMLGQFAALVRMDGLDGEELAYVARVREALLADYAKDLDDLQTVLAGGRLVTGDEERLKRVRALRADLTDKYVFAGSFCRQVRLLALQRLQEDGETRRLRRWYEDH